MLNSKEDDLMLQQFYQKDRNEVLFKVFQIIEENLAIIGEI